MLQWKPDALLSPVIGWESQKTGTDNLSLVVTSSEVVPNSDGPDFSGLFTASLCPHRPLLFVGKCYSPK